MKLGSKLLAAPLLTALVVFCVGQVNTWMTAREASANQEGFKSSFETFRTLSTCWVSLATPTNWPRPGRWRAVDDVGRGSIPSLPFGREYHPALQTSHFYS